MWGNHESPNPEVLNDDKAHKVFRFLTEKLTRQQGVIVGMHGTSAMNAQQIEERGLQNYTCVEGLHGVWFVDDSVSTQAHAHGMKKAHNQGDSLYAVITARLKRPTPDTKGRKQWLADSAETEILGIKYYNADE